MTNTLTPGDVYRYDPQTTHCREGLAIVTAQGQLVDTFWGLDEPTDPLTKHVLTDRERGTADFQFSITGLRPARWGEKIGWYPPGTVFVITAQHDRERYVYVVPGTKPDPKAIIREASADVRRAEQRGKRYEQELSDARAELGRLLDGGAAELAASYEVVE